MQRPRDQRAMPSKYERKGRKIGSVVPRSQIETKNRSRILIETKSSDYLLRVSLIWNNCLLLAKYFHESREEEREVKDYRVVRNRCDENCLFFLFHSSKPLLASFQQTSLPLSPLLRCRPIFVSSLESADVNVYPTASRLVSVFFEFDFEIEIDTGWKKGSRGKLCSSNFQLSNRVVTRPRSEV